MSNIHGLRKERKNYKMRAPGMRGILNLVKRFLKFRFHVSFSVDDSIFHIWYTQWMTPSFIKNG